DKKEYIEANTVCGTTIDGVLLKNGVPTVPIYGGLIKVEDYAPVKFSHLISLKETSISPIEAFLAKGMTSVLDVARNGEGLIPANFRIIPSSAKEKAKKIVKELSKIGINGVIDIGESGEDVLGVSVKEGMSGIPIVGGISPFCAALENDKDVLINLSGEINSYKNLKPLTKSKKAILKKSKNKKIKPLKTILYKSMNLMQKINFDIEDFSGNLLTNISFIKESDLNESIEIMADLYKKNPGKISNFYKIIDNQDTTSEFNKGISTICSLSIDGILNKNGVMCTPKYGGLLEARENPVFIELISYFGSSLDPHEIYIFKNMTNLTVKDGYQKLLASVKEVPYIAREKTLKILDNISDLGIQIIKVGKPQEVMFNSILDKYSFGIVTGSGLNQIAAINENKIEVKAKSQEGFTSLNEMEELI
ncbi:MAG: DUF128 domain-containing protein, partial [Methanobrevibacter sp.]|nr:DUF128 domain-containing protein [Methanobrevibacter sp.]